MNRCHHRSLPKVFLALILGCFLLMPAPALAKFVSDARIIIHIPSRTLLLYSGDNLVRSYPIGVGKPQFPTPMGSFKVIKKVLEPIFEDPFRPPTNGPGSYKKFNPLGTRWIGFHEDKGGEYGIHGTYDLHSVGQFSSHGCIRMTVKDAETLFDQVDFDTPVEVMYDPVWLESDGEEIVIKVFPDRFGIGKPIFAKVLERVKKQYPTAVLDKRLLARALQDASEHPVIIGTIPPSDGPQLKVKGKILSSLDKSKTSPKAPQ